MTKLAKPAPGTKRTTARCRTCKQEIELRPARTGSNIWSHTDGGTECAPFYQDREDKL